MHIKNTQSIFLGDKFGSEVTTNVTQTMWIQVTSKKKQSNLSYYPAITRRKKLTQELLNFYQVGLSNLILVCMSR